MIPSSSSTNDSRPEDVIGVFNDLEDRLNDEFAAHQKLEEGFARINPTVKCDAEWSDLLQCHEKLCAEKQSGDTPSPVDGWYTYASAIEKCGDKNDAFLQCAQRERVNFMRRLGRMIDRHEAQSKGGTEEKSCESDTT